MDRGAWQGSNPWGHKELDMTEATAQHIHSRWFAAKVKNYYPISFCNLPEEQAEWGEKFDLKNI